MPRAGVRVDFDGRDSKRPDFAWKGSAAIDGFEVYETQAQSRLGAWGRLALGGMDLTPKGLRIAAGRVSGLDARLEVLPDASLNIRALLEEDPEAAARAEALKGPDLKTLTGSARRAEKKRPVQAPRAALDARPALRPGGRSTRGRPDFPLTGDPCRPEARRPRVS